MRKLSVLVVILAVCAAGAFAQADTHLLTLDVDEVARFGVYDAAGGTANPLVTLTLDGAALAPGADPSTMSVDNAASLIYLRYTVISSDTYHISVSSDLNVPPGTALEVAASTPAGGGGTRGTGQTLNIAAGAPLSGNAVTGIGSCFTGTTNGADGSVVTYTFTVANAAALVQGSTAMTVTYTLTE